MKYVDPNGREIRIAGDFTKALRDIRQLVPSADRPSVSASVDGAIVRLNATALSEHQSQSENFALLTRLAVSSAIVELDTSSATVATTSRAIQGLGGFALPANYNNPEGLLGITLSPYESQSGNIHIQVNPFLSGAQTAGTLAEELVHADFETRGLDSKHSVDIGKPNQPLQTAIRKAFDEALKNFDPFLPMPE